MRTFLVFIALICYSAIFAQYKNPYRMAYDGLNYYVTNNANGTVTRINSNFQTQTVLTGLRQPTDIFFGSFLGNDALILIDSNKLKLYDTANFSSLLSINITNAVEAHDGIFNPKNPNEFFISDRGGNKIIKGSIGSAPFFPITFSVLTSGISKPSGIIFNKQGKLVVVTDTANAKVLEVDPKTGSIATKISTTYNRFNDVAQDNEGNYYVTCWGNDNLYRYDKDYKNEYKVNSFNNPSGMYVNGKYDIMGICCTNCQKVEFYFFHLFSPLNDISTCKGVDFYTDFLPSYKGIGTYNSDNVFLVEMSDSNGSFSSPIVIGADTTSIRPKSILAKVPDFVFDNTTYRYRFKSTSPEVISYFDKELSILNHSDAFISNFDTIQTCQNGTVRVGKASESNTTYHWSPASVVEDTALSQSALKTDTSGFYEIKLVAKNTLSGCVSTRSKILSVQQKLELSLEDTLAVCAGDTLIYSLEKIPYVSNWSGSGFSIDTAENNLVYFSANSNTLYIAFADSQNTCTGKDSLYVKIKPLPKLAGVPERIWFCEGDTFTLHDFTIGNVRYWHLIDSLEAALTPLSSTKNTYIADSVGIFDVGYGATDLATNCSYSEWSDVAIKNTPDSLMISYDDENQAYTARVLGNFFSGTISWYINGTKVAESDTLNRWRLKDGDTLQATYTSFDECEIASELKIFSSASVTQLKRQLVCYPNPTNGVLMLKGVSADATIAVYNATGVLVYQNPNTTPLDLSEMPDGIYSLKVEEAGVVLTHKVIKTN
jgi:hypothetical protein